MRLPGTSHMNPTDVRVQSSMEALGSSKPDTLARYAMNDLKNSRTCTKTPARTFPITHTRQLLADLSCERKSRPWGTFS